jgi:hypothetical protein
MRTAGLRNVVALRPIWLVAGRPPSIHWWEEWVGYVPVVVFRIPLPMQDSGDAPLMRRAILSKKNTQRARGIVGVKDDGRESRVEVPAATTLKSLT